MKVSKLSESPTLIEPEDFNLNDEAKNIDAAKDLLRDHFKTVLKKDEDYVLYKFKRAYALINMADKDRPRIAYVMKFSLNVSNVLKRKCASQILVWADRTDVKTENVAKNIFFDYLLPEHKTVITDSHQTKDGQGFWDRRISQSFLKGLYVYYVNLTPGHHEIVHLKNIEDFRNCSRDNSIWGKEEKNSFKRIVITSELIKEETK